MHAYHRLLKHRKPRPCEVCGRKTTRLRLCRTCKREHRYLTTAARLIAAFA